MYADMYPFGTNFTFQILVENIQVSPPIFVYRPISEHHIKSILVLIVENPSITPDIANLLPYSKKTHKVVDVLKYGDEKNLASEKDIVLRWTDDKDIVFFTISCQHLSQTQKLIHEMNNIPQWVRDKNQTRKSKILVAGKPALLYQELF